jgi:hypothetical protein
MFESAAAVIFATDPLRDYAAARYRLPPHEVIPLRPLARDLCFTPLRRIPRTLVYAGGIQRRGAIGTPWGYRVYHDLFAAAIAAGWQMHVYPARLRSNVVAEYTGLGCVVHPTVPERTLPAELSQYSAGLQAFNEGGVAPDALAYARLAWPNKTWLYLAAGIATIGVNAGFESCRIYEGRWGVVVDPKRFPGPDEVELPVVDEQLRCAETMDADLPRLRALLERVTPATH